MPDFRSKPSIAVVDSNPNDRKALGYALNEFYAISQFADADTAIDGLRRSPPALVLVDEMLTPCGGYEFVTTMRADRASPSPPGAPASPVNRACTP